MLFNKFNSVHLLQKGVFPFLTFSKKPIQCTKRYKSKRDQYVCTQIKTNTPHPPKDPPEDYNPSCLDHSAFETPTNVQPLVFRPLIKTDVLGPNASKDKAYKNPEYFSYHRFSHVDLFVNAMRIRMEKRMEQMSPDSAKKKEACQCQVCGCEVCTCGDDCQCGKKENTDEEISCDKPTEEMACDKPKEAISCDKPKAELACDKPKEEVACNKPKEEETLSCKVTKEGDSKTKENERTDTKKYCECDYDSKKCD